ncbi:unnamed protein product [Boreogadus saida]
MTKATYTQGEREERIVDIYATIESLGDQHQDYVGTEESSNTLGTVRSQQPDPVSPPRCPIRAVVVLLVLLSLTLLSALLGYSREWGSWNNSRELCVTDGADLVVVNSKEEMDFISRYGRDPWLGATDEAGEGLWRWVDGTVLSAASPSWSGGKPDGGKDKNCLRRDWGQHNIKWTDESCEDYKYGLCEYNLMK